MKVLVCGGRDYDDGQHLFEQLDVLHLLHGFTSLVHGGAKGADTLSGMWAIEHDVPVQIYYADWEQHGRKAGALRNIQMLKEAKPDLVVAFPGGRGTEHMVRIAKEAGVRVIEP